MADEPENHTLALLREMRAEMKERFDRIETDLASHRAETQDKFEELRGDLAMHRLDTNRDLKTIAVASPDTLQAVRQLRKHLNLADA
jgi:hypothetical protein